MTSALDFANTSNSNPIRITTFISLQSRRFFGRRTLVQGLKFVMGRHFESTQPVED